ncbi:MAG: hypothetical protein HWE22_10400 [Flavobacteriales bacterium]|nr:hypothetical protein [Flavobacteriales bacterium]
MKEPNKSNSFQLLNGNNEPVTDAEFSINGSGGAYSEKSKKYELKYRSKSTRLYDIVISHPDYLTISAENIRVLPDKIYLLKKDEPYYFLEGLNYPVNDNADFLYLTRMGDNNPETDSSLQARFERLLENLGLEVHFLMSDFLRKSSEPFHRAPGEHLKRSYIVKKKQGEYEMKGARCIELEKLRAEVDLVEYAGPLISNEESFSDATTFPGTLTISMRKDEVDQEKMRQFFEGMGLTNYGAGTTGGYLNFYFDMPGYLLNGVNDLTELIYNLNGVEYSGAHQLSFTFFVKK